MTEKKNKHIGSSFDDFLKDDGIYEEVTATAIKRVIAREIAEEMKAKKITKARMATLMKSSRSAVDRLLDPKQSSVTLRTLLTAAGAVGKELHIELK